VWDLHYASPTAVMHDYPISAVPHRTPRLPLGPTALPGQYIARLTVDGQSYSAQFTVRMDPRVKASPEALEKKFQAELTLAKLTDGLSRATLEANSLAKQVDALGKTSSAAVQQEVTSFQKKLAAISGKGGPAAADADQPTLTHQGGAAVTLYGQVWQADAEPTSAQATALRSLQQSSSTVLGQWAQFKSTDLPALNDVLQRNGLTKLTVEVDPAAGDFSVDEE
jgi:hypothetical protein